MFVNDIFKKKQLDEGGPFSSTEPKKPRKGSVADLAAKKRKEQEKDKQPVEPRDHMVGVARVVKEGEDLSQYSTERLKAYVKKVSGGGVPAFGSGARLKRVQAELKRREQGVAEGWKGALAGGIAGGMLGGIPGAVIGGLGGYALGGNNPENLPNDPELAYKLGQKAARNGKSWEDNPYEEGMFGPSEEMDAWHDGWESIKKGVAEGSAQDRLHKRHQELRKKSGLPDPDYYKELKASYDLPDSERYSKQKEIKQKYKVTNEDRERYIEELGRAGYEIVTEKKMTCPECGGAAYADRMLAEKQDACYHKVKSRYKVWPSAYASGALVRCRKKGAKNWGNKSK
jgi:hypothetical protein